MRKKIRNHKRKLSTLTCEKCLQTGCVSASQNVDDEPYINTLCHNCHRHRKYRVYYPIRDNEDKIVDYMIDIRPSPIGIRNAKISLSPIGDEPYVDLKGNISEHKPTRRTRNMNDKHEKITGKHVKYLDVLAYVLDDEGIPVDKSIDGSDFNDVDLGHARIEDNTEDAAPKDGFKHSITPEEKLRYRNVSKPMQATSSIVRDGNVIIGDSYIPINVFTEKDNSILSKNSKRDLLLSSLEEDGKLHKQSGKSNSVYVESCGTQWCPKVRKAIAFHVCSQYCIDGRRIPQTDKEFETYQEYLVKGGNDSGYVFCGYKDWLKREVDSFYPGWVEDHIVKSGGEVSKNTSPYQHKMNLDPGQRRNLEQYPYMKGIETRLQEKNHNYDDFEMKVSENLDKKIVVSKKVKKKSNIKNFQKVISLLTNLLTALNKKDFKSLKESFKKIFKSKNFFSKIEKENFYLDIIEDAKELFDIVHKDEITDSDKEYLTELIYDLLSILQDLGLFPSPKTSSNNNLLKISQYNINDIYSIIEDNKSLLENLKLKIINVDSNDEKEKIIQIVKEHILEFNDVDPILLYDTLIQKGIIDTTNKETSKISPINKRSKKVNLFKI